MPSTCVNRSSSAALLSDRNPDKVRWLTGCNPHSHWQPGSYSHCRASSRAELIPRLYAYSHKLINNRVASGDQKSTRLTPVTLESRMPSSPSKKKNTNKHLHT